MLSCCRRARLGMAVVQVWWFLRPTQSVAVPQECRWRAPLPPVEKAPWVLCQSSLAQAGVGWEASSQPCPGNGPRALLVMKGIHLQHRPVWGTGTLTHWKCHRWERYRRSCASFPRLLPPQPPAHWGPKAAPTSQPTVCPRDGGGFQGSASVSVSFPGLSRQPRSVMHTR